MKQIHFVFARINPTLKIDYVRIGEVVDGQFKSVDLKTFSGESFYPFIQRSDISDTTYIMHSNVSAFLLDLSTRKGFGLDFFDNTMVVFANFKCDTNESSPKEENKGL